MASNAAPLKLRSAFIATHQRAAGGRRRGEIDEQIADSVHQRGLPIGLYQEVELGGESSYRVWVKSWSEVLTAADEAVEFFRAEMDFDPDALEAVEMLRRRFPDHVPVGG